MWATIQELDMIMPNQRGKMTWCSCIEFRMHMPSIVNWSNPIIMKSLVSIDPESNITITYRSRHLSLLALGSMNGRFDFHIELPTTNTTVKANIRTSRLPLLLDLQHWHTRYMHTRYIPMICAALYQDKSHSYWCINWETSERRKTLIAVIAYQQ